ncbi:MAG: hypothetical protein JSW72_02660 [Candidatus Bathyarchaeota archaeon]|nr:MAG: hypothetical protein JSW72_02660 [Candidatus Bathyarchaeota archaeon]
MNNGESDIQSRIKINRIHPKDMTKKEWIEDFYSFFNMMKDNFPYFWVKERLLGYNWTDLKNRYLERLEKANEDLEFLAIFWDAVCALQNAHTTLWMPERMKYHFQEDGYFQKTEPFKTIFSPQVKEANFYWKPILDKSFEIRFGTNFEVLILYHKGDYLIVDGFDGWKEKFGLGTKIIAVDGKPIDDAIRNTYEKGNIDWDFKRKKICQFTIAPRHFGADAQFTIVKRNGEQETVVFKSDTKYSYENLFKYPDERLTIRIWPDKKIGYLRIKSFEDEYKDQEHDFLISFYKQIEDFDYLIIDVTGNQGGSYQPWAANVVAPLTKEKLESKMYLGYRKGKYVNLFRKMAETAIETIVPKEAFDFLPPEVLTDDFTVYDYTYTVEPSNEVDFKGKIILLVDKVTFSATDAFALFCKETGFATLYGEPTGGDGISESPVYYVLPNSKLVIRFTPGMGIDYTGNSNEEMRVHPHVFYEYKLRNHNDLIEFTIEKLAKK